MAQARGEKVAAPQGTIALSGASHSDGAQLTNAPSPRKPPPPRRSRSSSDGLDEGRAVPYVTYGLINLMV